MPTKEEYFQELLDQFTDYIEANDPDEESRIRERIMRYFEITPTPFLSTSSTSFS